MLLSKKYSFIKWVPLTLSILFAAIVLGNELEVEDIRERHLPVALAVLTGIAALISVIVWIYFKTTLCCPNCNSLVGSRYDTRICRRCGLRL